jgi:hypothetical protein
MATNARVFDAAIPEERSTRKHDVRVAGVVGGIAAGAAMMVAAMVGASVEDLRLARPLELPALMFLGDDAEGGAAALLGLLIWFAVSAVLGAIFASVVPSDFPFASSAMLGVGYAFILLALMSNVALPAVNPAMRAEMTVMGGGWVIAYAVFGVVLGVVPYLRRRVLAAR